MSRPFSTGSIAGNTDYDSDAPALFTIIDGSAGIRRLVSSLLRSAWPHAEITAIDPFSQTMFGAGFVHGGKAQAIILGGIGTEAEGLRALERLAARQDATPIVMLVAAELHAIHDLFIAAGATAVIRKDKLSGRTLIDAILRAGQNHAASPVATNITGDNFSERFHFIHDGVETHVEVPGFRQSSVISSNPMAHVFTAERISDGCRAVVKLLASTPHHDLDLISRFCRRYEFLCALNGRHTVSYLDAGVAGSWPYVALEFLGEGDLRQRIKAGLTPNQAAQILFRLAGAMAALHSGRLAHMDLKPDNIFFRADESLVLIDFNISTPFGKLAKNRDTGDVLGTPFYMSPEQGQGLPIDARSDLYSAGVVFYEMLTGDIPYKGESAAQILFRHIHEEIPLLPKASRQFQGILDKLMAKNRDERFATSVDLAFALRPLLITESQA